MTSSEVVVVGAGPAGLAAAAAAQRRGRTVVVLERGAGVGTRWRSRYDGLRLNTMRQLSSLPGLRMPRSYGRWPDRDDFVRYLEAYVDHHRLDVRFEVCVERVGRAAQGWTLATSEGDLQARHVVVATGYDAVPRMPRWPGMDTFLGPLLHAAKFRSAADHAGQHVLVVGGGNTGIDIAGLLVRAGALVSVAVRTPPSIFPRQLYGLPLQPSGIALDHLPARWGDAVGRTAQWLAFGDLTGHGLARAPEGFQTRFRRSRTGPAVDDGFVAALKAGRARVVAVPARLDGAVVELTDETVEHPDVIVCATGYHRGLEELVGHLGVLDDDGLPVDPVRPPGAPGLSFVGFEGSPAGQIRLMPPAARRVARSMGTSDTPARGLLHHDPA